jgi:flagellar motor switch protein FliG
MAEIDYQKLSRQQKLAIFLIVIGAEAAAEVLRQFDDREIEALCKEMAAFAIVPESLQRLALEEFTGVVAQGATSVFGGMSYAQRTLGIAKGDYKASSIMSHVGPVDTAVDVIKDIGEMEPRQIFNLIKGEQPQTIALVLSHLDSAKTADIFTLLGPEMRDDVIERLGTIESTPIEVVGKIARSLGKHFDTKTRPTLHHSGGVRAVATLLNQLKKDVSKALLTRLEERNATLGAEIRKKMFSFEDLIRLQPGDLQRVMREVDTTGLATAMKSASEPLREKIYAALSKRAAEGLREEIDMLGPVRLKDVEAAQEIIIAAVRHLEEEGQISLENDPAQLVGG